MKGSNSIQSKVTSTGRENQRVDFVDSLYKSLKKKAEVAYNKHNKLCALSSVYLSDGLDPQECAELLIIEGNISREAANAYISMAQAKQPEINEDGGEYSFQFEDIHGKVWSSHDIGMTVRASSDDEAWEKAEEVIFINSGIEPDKVVSVDRIS
jgi:hypothetical protein